LANLNELYDENFYKAQVDGSFKSAEIILGLLYTFFKPQEVIDVGCGQGGWLAIAESLGAKGLKGLDGKWVKKDTLLSKNIDFVEVNFEEANLEEANLEEVLLKLDKKYDLCMSLEVAEHVSQKNAEKFIDFLCETSDIVLFSAAIKEQGGVNHINEQWQPYWIDLFKSNHYKCIDCFRGEIWNNPLVKWWYRQNIFLFVGPDNSVIDLEALKILEKSIVNCAHPENYESKIKFYNSQIKHVQACEKDIEEYKKQVVHYQNLIEKPSLRFILSSMKRYIKKKLAFGK